jgi:hypothetical protein
MTAEFESLTLQHLRAMREDLRYLRDKFDDLEQQLIHLHSSDAKHTEASAHFYRRFREYELRLNRIEQRLSLNEESSS